MKIALVYDWINKFGGAERILLALHKIYPSAPLFTAVYDEVKADWAKDFDVRPSLINRLPFLQDRHEILPLITPYIFESFNFDNFDVVISVTSADAKGIITKPGTLHICYCLTPTRYIWSGYKDYTDEPGMGRLNLFARLFTKVFSHNLRSWDYLASSRPDLYIAISHTVATRIYTYYKRQAEVVYPPVDTDKFVPNNNKKRDYYLVVSRLVPYKKIDYVVSAFNMLGWKLKIIGNGIDEKRLKKMARDNIEFIDGNLTDEKLCWYYQNCHALIFPGEEDFGLTAVEAQASGRPVIGYGRGGITEIVIAGKTGELYDAPDERTLISLLQTFKAEKYSSSLCRQNSKRFEKLYFQSRMKKMIENYWSRWKKRL